MLLEEEKHVCEKCTLVKVSKDFLEDYKDLSLYSLLASDQYKLFNCDNTTLYLRRKNVYGEDLNVLVFDIGEAIGNTLYGNLVKKIAQQATLEFIEKHLEPKNPMIDDPSIPNHCGHCVPLEVLERIEGFEGRKFYVAYCPEIYGLVAKFKHMKIGYSHKIFPYEEANPYGSDLGDIDLSDIWDRYKKSGIIHANRQFMFFTQKNAPSSVTIAPPESTKSINIYTLSKRVLK